MGEERPYEHTPTLFYGSSLFPHYNKGDPPPIGRYPPIHTRYTSSHTHDSLPLAQYSTYK